MLSEKSPRPKGKCRPVPLARVPRTGRSAATGSSAGCQGGGRGGGWELLAKTTKLRRCWRWPRNGEDALKNGKKGEFYVIYVSQ